MNDLPQTRPSQENTEKHINCQHRQFTNNVKMTAIATQFNPGDPGDDILAFYNDKAANLGFELVPASSSGVVTYTSADPETSGLIRNPSQLAAIYFKNLVRQIRVSRAWARIGDTSRR